MKYKRSKMILKITVMRNHGILDKAKQKALEVKNTVGDTTTKRVVKPTKELNMY